jgi:hypothetical protein
LAIQAQIVAFQIPFQFLSNFFPISFQIPFQIPNISNISLDFRMASAAAACMICMSDKFNKTTKTKTECMFCHEVICRECLKACLLNDAAVDVCCPGCRAVWNQEFLVANLPVTFRTGSLKKHREKVLFDREKIRLTLHMDDARRYKTAKEAAAPIRARMDALRATYEAIPVVTARIVKKKAAAAGQSAWFRGSISREELETIRGEYYTAHSAFMKDTEAVRLKMEIKDAKRMLRQYLRPINTLGAGPAMGGAGGGAGGGSDSVPPATEKTRRIVMACPAAGCAGFVDTLWKCGVCEIKICNKCRVIKGGDGHECNADDIATAEALAAECKPCPKCAAAISKISGCDQMWCTICHTTFSWNTGKIETSVIHNPHYFQWAAANGHALPRADLPGVACDINDMMTRTLWREIANANTIRDLDERRARKELLDTIAERQRWRLDLEAGALRRMRDRVREHMEGEWRREMCVKRLSGDMSETDWQIALQRAEKAHHKERAWLQLMEMYAVTTRDILGRFATEATPDLTDIIAQHNRLLEFARDQSIAISKAYQCVFLKLTPSMKAPAKASASAKGKKTVAAVAVGVAVAVGGAGGGGAGGGSAEVVEIDDD